MQKIFYSTLALSLFMRSVFYVRKGKDFKGVVFAFNQTIVCGRQNRIRCDTYSIVGCIKFFFRIQIFR